MSHTLEKRHLQQAKLTEARNQSTQDHLQTTKTKQTSQLKNGQKTLTGKSQK